jgi:hypothetical protein
VVDEQQHVLVLHVAEVLGHRQRGQRDPQAGARRLVHLTEDEGGLPDHVGLGHLGDQVVSLTGTLTDPGEHRDAVVVACHPSDHLLDQHRLADPGSAEQADLAALDVRRQQVDDLDAGVEHLGLRLEGVERGCSPVDLPPLLHVEHLTFLQVEAVADGVEDMSLGHIPDRHADGATGIGDDGAPHEPVGGLHRDGPDHAVADVQGHLEGQRPRLAAEGEVDVQGVVHVGHVVARELDVDNRSGHAGDPADGGVAVLGFGVVTQDGGHVFTLFRRSRRRAR